MCAVYAFMRRADDISDDESKPIEARRAEMDRWLQRLARLAHPIAAPVNTSHDPVFLALGDTQRASTSPTSLLEELVAGTTMDLEPRAPNEESQPQTYATFDDLYRYCYLVASVVGLVCIRIFGYTDPRAEKLAEETGVAFQLTNILRDVKEDAERNRIYSPSTCWTSSANPSPNSASSPRPRHDRARARHARNPRHPRRKILRRRRQAHPPCSTATAAPPCGSWSPSTTACSRIAAHEMDVFTERVSVSTPAKLASSPAAHSWPHGTGCSVERTPDHSSVSSSARASPVSPPHRRSPGPAQRHRAGAPSLRRRPRLLLPASRAR
jgi:phytoene synthase